MPELPADRRDRYAGQLGLSAYDATLIASEREYADLFDEAIALYAAAEDGRELAQRRGQAAGRRRPRSSSRG